MELDNDSETPGLVYCVQDSPAACLTFLAELIERLRPYAELEDLKEGVELSDPTNMPMTINAGP